MTFSIDRTRSTPVYAQLADAIRLAVREGRLAPGDAMPTVRQLAVELAINANTVARVYRELSAEGLLRLERGVGTFVDSSAAPAMGARERRSIERAADRLVELALKTRVSRGELVQLLERRWKELSGAQGADDAAR